MRNLIQYVNLNYLSCAASTAVKVYCAVYVKHAMATTLAAPAALAACMSHDHWKASTICRYHINCVPAVVVNERNVIN